MTDFGRPIPVAPLLVDGTRGRYLRFVSLRLRNGTQDQTIKCTLTDLWNGTDIPETDNVGKGLTVNGFTLDAPGYPLRVENASLEGRVLAVLGNIAKNQSDTFLTLTIDATGADIYIYPRHASDATPQDFTALVDQGTISMFIAYITDA